MARYEGSGYEDATRRMAEGFRRRLTLAGLDPDPPRSRSHRQQARARCRARRRSSTRPRANTRCRVTWLESSASHRSPRSRRSPSFRPREPRSSRAVWTRTETDPAAARIPPGSSFSASVTGAQLAPNGELELATCSHPVTGGKGDFKRTKGFLMFVDTPTTTEPFVSTEYEGFLSRKKRRSSHARMDCP